MRYIGAIITLAFLLPPALMKAQETAPQQQRESIPLPRPRPQAQAMPITGACSLSSTTLPSCDSPRNDAGVKYSAEMWERARRIRQLPPPEYDRPYTGRLTITRARDKVHLAQLCKLKTPNIACAWPKADSCEIIMVPDEMIVADGFMPELVFRHERGHCESWPKDHPGQRVWNGEHDTGGLSR